MNCQNCGNNSFKDQRKFKTQLGTFLITYRGCRQCKWIILKDLELTEETKDWNRAPDLEIEVWISNIGIQYDIYQNIQGYYDSSCRDFGDTHEREFLTRKLYAWFYQILNIFKTTH